MAEVKCDECAKEEEKTMVAILEAPGRKLMRAMHEALTAYQEEVGQLPEDVQNDARTQMMFITAIVYADAAICKGALPCEVAHEALCVFEKLLQKEKSRAIGRVLDAFMAKHVEEKSKENGEGN